MAVRPDKLRRRVAHGQFDGGFWTLLNDPVSRHQLREALIARYFPEKREELAGLVVGAHLIRPADTLTRSRPLAQPDGPSTTRIPSADSDSAEVSPSDAEQAMREELPPAPARDAAFRRTILEAYDYRCAACGMRVLLDQQISMVEAAHLIPFGVSRNDKPTNGVALCPNHHWAMDRHLIAPCPDTKRRAGMWRVNEQRLDDRIGGQRDLVALAGKCAIPGADSFTIAGPTNS